MNWAKVPLDLIARVSAAVEERPVCSPVLLHIAATIWCRQYARDGIIPADVIATLEPWSKSGPRPAATAERLVDADVWAVDGASFRLLDFAFQAIPVELSDERSRAAGLGNCRKWHAKGCGCQNGEEIKPKSNRSNVASQSSQIAIDDRKTRNSRDERREEERREEKKRERDIPLPPSSGSETGASAPEPASPALDGDEKFKPHPNRQAYIDDFHAAYKAATGGAVYTWTPKDRGAANDACSEIPAATWKLACAGYATRKPAWIFKDGNPGVSTLRRNVNDFADAGRGPATANADRPAWVTDDPLEKMTEEERAEFFKRESERVKYGRD